MLGSVWSNRKRPPEIKDIGSSPRLPPEMMPLKHEAEPGPSGPMLRIKAGISNVLPPPKLKLIDGKLLHGTVGRMMKPKHQIGIGRELTAVISTADELATVGPMQIVHLRLITNYRGGTGVDDGGYISQDCPVVS